MGPGNPGAGPYTVSTYCFAGNLAVVSRPPSGLSPLPTPARGLLTSPPWASRRALDAPSARPSTVLVVGGYGAVQSLSAIRPVAPWPPEST